jgi:two-component system OmpR family response regulator
VSVLPTPNPPRLAIVDDDQDLLDLMPLACSEWGWECLAITDSATACNQIAVAAPDAVLLDLHLESRNRGMDVLQQLLDRPDTAGIPVILWTADAYFLAEREAWLRERGIKVLAKPFEIDELAALLDALRLQAVAPRPTPAVERSRADVFETM